MGGGNRCEALLSFISHSGFSPWAFVGLLMGGLWEDLRQLSGWKISHEAVVRKAHGYYFNDM